MKKIWVLMLVVVMVVTLFSACNKEKTTDVKEADTTTTTEKTTDAPAPTVTEPIVIKLWHYYENADAFNSLIAAFNEENKDVQIEVEYVPREELMKQYTMGAVGGQLPDIGLVDNPDQAAFIQMGTFLDITDLVEAWGEADQYFTGPLKSATVDGKIYGLPSNSNCLALYYDIDALKAAGVEPPTTWDELLIAAEKTTNDNTYGLAISAPKNEEGTFQYLPWLLSAGANIEHLDSPESIKSLAYLTNLVQKGYMSLEVINWTQADVEKQFASGQAAMMVNGPWNIGSVKADAPDKNWAVTLLPKDQVYASVLGGENFGICSTLAPEKKEAAFTVLKYLCAGMTLKWSQDYGIFPSRSDIMALSTHITSDPILKVFADEMQYAMPRGPHAKWPQISDAISTSLQKALSGATTPEVACQEAQTQVNDILSAK